MIYNIYEDKKGEKKSFPYQIGLIKIYFEKIKNKNFMFLKFFYGNMPWEPTVAGRGKEIGRYPYQNSFPQNFIFPNKSRES